MKKIETTLHSKIETVVTSMGYEFVGCELMPMNGSKIFRIFIDTATGVTLDDCSKVSRQVGAMMDVEEPFQGRYSLEVSSPGIDRPLFEVKHFQQFVGSQVKIRLHTAINQQRQYKGKLKQVEGENIHLLVEGSEKEVILPYDQIDKANVIGDVRINLRTNSGEAKQ